MREILAGAARFWEPRRLVYNFLLAAVAVVWVAGTWPHFRQAFTLHSLLLLSVLALLANLCYCSAYLLDVSMQPSAPSSAWFLSRRIIWVLGTVLAIVLENYWIADEIYPFVR
jgi:hypothetical protein